MTVADNNKDNSHDIGVGSATTYDNNGNIETMRRGGVDKSYNLYSGTNRVQNTDGSGNDYVYDQNGNLSTASARTTPVTLTYDVFTNMTMQVTKTATGRKQKYQYDARNVRVMKMDDSTWSTLYLHGLNDYPLVEKTSTTERIYIYGPTGLIVIKEGTSKRYVQKDHLGSTRVLYDESGEAVMVYEYDAYGKCIARLENSQAKYRFTGQEYESESDLYNFRARFYDSDDLVGFYAPDPAGETYAPYSYCGGNPIIYIDPTGRYLIDLFSYYTPDQDADADERKQVEKEKEQNKKALDDKEKEKKKKVAIDPGHGDQNDGNKVVDPGAVSGEDKEKDITLKISDAVTEELKNKGYDVVQTRVGDVTNAGVRLDWRIKKVDGTDMLISIHINSSENAEANGFQVLYKSGDAESKSLAESIKNENTLFKDRGISANKDLYLLKHYKGTAVLVEAGYISNKNDLVILKTKVAEVAKQISNGIAKYLGGR